MYEGKPKYSTADDSFWNDCYPQQTSPQQTSPKTPEIATNKIKMNQEETSGHENKKTHHKDKDTNNPNKQNKAEKAITANNKADKFLNPSDTTRVANKQTTANHTRRTQSLKKHQQDTHEVNKADKPTPITSHKVDTSAKVDAPTTHKGENVGTSTLTTRQEDRPTKAAKEGKPTSDKPTSTTHEQDKPTAHREDKPTAHKQIQSLKRIGDPVDYKYMEVVRKKADREKLQGFACQQCKDYYEHDNLSESRLRELMQECSRHRSNHGAPAEDDADYWKIGFPPTQEYMDKGNMLEGVDGLPQEEREFLSRRTKKKYKYANV